MPTLPSGNVLCKRRDGEGPGHRQDRLLSDLLRARARPVLQYRSGRMHDEQLIGDLGASRPRVVRFRGGSVLAGAAQHYCVRQDHWIVGRLPHVIVCAAAAQPAAGARRSGQPRSARQPGPRHSGRSLGGRRPEAADTFSAHCWCG